jgi:hypothetical protein
MEHDHFVNAVAKFGAERLVVSVHDLRFEFAVGGVGVADVGGAIEKIKVLADDAVPTLLVMMMTVFLKSTTRP